MTAFGVMPRLEIAVWTSVDVEHTRRQVSRRDPIISITGPAAEWIGQCLRDAVDDQL